MITLFTIGFTKKSAEHFFELLKKYHVKKIIDIRINNTSQLAGFAKGVDLSYFAQQICGIEYTWELLNITIMRLWTAHYLIINNSPRQKNI